MKLRDGGENRRSSEVHPTRGIEKVDDGVEGHQAERSKEVGVEAKTVRHWGSRQSSAASMDN